MHLSILIWLPAAAGLVGALLPGRPRRGSARVPASLRHARACRSRSLRRRFDTGRGLQFVTDKMWISELGHPLQARRRRAELFLILLDDAAVRGRDAVGRAARRGSAARALLPLARARRDRRARRLMAQDLALFVAFFDLMLIPFYFLTGQLGRRAGPRRRRDQARHLHARRLAADARGGGRDRRARRRHGRRDINFALVGPRRSARCSATARRSGSSCASRPPSW